MSFIRRTWVLSALFLLPLNSFSPAADNAAPSAWDVKRTTEPESVDELKALQAKVKAVQKKATACTVGLLLAGSDRDSERGGMSCGSGVIVSDDGLVLTAAHVIAKPRERVLFVLADGRRVGGITMGLNSLNDSGMAKITDKPPKGYGDAEDGKWPFLPVGTSADLKRGQWIVSMGHPGGPKTDRPPPVRTGRYLSLNLAGFYEDDGDQQYDSYKPGRWRQRNDLLKTDATLVGGGSGGPLFDLDAKVTGIHSEIGEELAVNRHVPIEKFQAEWDRLARGDVIYRSKPEMERNTKVAMNLVFDDSATGGAKIEEIRANGAAEKAGLEAGDLIVTFNGNKVKSADDLRQMLPSYKVGEKVKVEVDRGGNTVAVDVKLVERSKD